MQATHLLSCVKKKKLELPDAVPLSLAQSCEAHSEVSD
jgi:hypothetical protein